jgi:hypothetical protein
MTPAFEAFLARVYVDAGFRALFLADPSGEAKRAGLSKTECQALEKIDREGLQQAARSFEAKRGKQRRAGWIRRLLNRYWII